MFPQFFSMVKNQFGMSIKTLWSDDAKNYFNNKLNTFFSKMKVSFMSLHVLKYPNKMTLLRKNGHFLDQTCVILFQNKVPKKYQDETILTASYLINYLSSIVLASKNPMKVLSSFYPNVTTSSNLTPRMFGYMTFTHIYSDGRGKLDPEDLKCIFI